MTICKLIEYYMAFKIINNISYEICLSTTSGRVKQSTKLYVLSD